MNKLILEMLNVIGLPYANTCFAEGEAPDLPYVIFLILNNDDLFADGENYYKQIIVHFELYTEKKNITAEEKVQQVIKRYGITYSKTQTWIASEKMYEVLYTFELEDEEDDC